MYNHSGSIALGYAVIDGAATRVATVGKQYAVPIYGVVVHVVVTYE